MKNLLNFILSLWSVSPVLTISKDFSSRGVQIEEPLEDVRLSLISIATVHFFTFNFSSKKFSLFYINTPLDINNYERFKEKPDSIDSYTQENLINIIESDKRKISKYLADQSILVLAISFLSFIYLLFFSICMYTMFKHSILSIVIGFISFIYIATSNIINRWSIRWSTDAGVIKKYNTNTTFEKLYANAFANRQHVRLYCYFVDSFNDEIVISSLVGWILLILAIIARFM